jgi:hypothetical protein
MASIKLLGYFMHHRDLSALISPTYFDAILKILANTISSTQEKQVMNFCVWVYTIQNLSVDIIRPNCSLILEMMRIAAENPFHSSAIDMELVNVRLLLWLCAI